MRNKWKELGWILPIGLWLIVSDMLGITTCPFRLFFGVSCASCGMSRAWHALLQGNLELAPYFHPLFWLPVPALVLFCLRRRIPKRVVNTIWGIMIALLLVVYVIRLCHPNQRVVVFDPSEGILFRVLRGLEQCVKALINEK